MLTGEWEVEGRRATLEIDGGHLMPAGKTSFFGLWKTPLSSKGGAPSLLYDFEFTLIDDLSFLDKLEFLVRWRQRHEPWSKWRETPIDFDPESHFVEGQGEHVVIFDAPARAQFEWMIRGRLTGPAALSGSIDVRLRR